MDIPFYDDVRDCVPPDFRGNALVQDFIAAVAQAVYLPQDDARILLQGDDGPLVPLYYDGLVAVQSDPVGASWRQRNAVALGRALLPHPIQLAAAAALLSGCQRGDQFWLHLDAFQPGGLSFAPYVVYQGAVYQVLARIWPGDTLPPLDDDCRLIRGGSFHESVTFVLKGLPSPPPGGP